MDHLLIASTTTPLLEAIWTWSFYHGSCQRRKVWRIANISRKLICFDRCLVGIHSENICRLYTPPIPFRPFASVAKSWLILEGCINEIADQIIRNCFHHCRSFLAARERRILRSHDPSWQSIENKCRRNGHPRGTTWQQWERKPRVSWRAEMDTDEEERSESTAFNARCFLLWGRWTSILIELNSNPRWMIIHLFESFSAALDKPNSERIRSNWRERGLTIVSGGRQRGNHRGSE